MLRHLAITSYMLLHAIKLGECTSPPSCPSGSTASVSLFYCIKQACLVVMDIKEVHDMYTEYPVQPNLLIAIPLTSGHCCHGHTVFSNTGIVHCCHFNAIRCSTCKISDDKFSSITSCHLCSLCTVTCLWLIFH